MTAKRLRAKFDRDLKKLQDECSHKKTNWMPFMWAMGHFGADVKVCDRCEKILDRKEEHGNIIIDQKPILE